jgi:hypothetical protein
MGDAIGHSNIAVQPGALYRHFKGGLYVVFAVLESSNKKENETMEDHTAGLMVAYMNLETGKKYWRPMYGEDGFTTPKVTEDGYIARFTFCGYAEEIRIDQRGRYYITHKY